MIEAKEFEEVAQMAGDCHATYAFIDNVWVRMMHFKKKGDKNIPHKHTHDHASLLSSGSLKVTVDGKDSIFKAPCIIVVHKDQYHFMEALEDNTVSSCIHGIRDIDSGDILSPEMVPEGSLITLPSKVEAFSAGSIREEMARNATAN